MTAPQRDGVRERLALRFPLTEDEVDVLAAFVHSERARFAEELADEMAASVGDADVDVKWLRAAAAREMEG